MIQKFNQLMEKLMILKSKIYMVADIQIQKKYLNIVHGDF